ncbi:MAG: nucleotidyltransferase family protein [Candidatus Thiothrix putei]|uniref:Nucleotidyltransferase family protein n=1 Tax=Candidatus Thiothrix putei TaxID=3080811 RepID=A0AA95KL27_9GAMM|nr:MAG: nucleotidyltransferase family protein [Candidatus Thiothrix putei]
MTTAIHTRLRTHDSFHPLLHNTFGFVLSALSLSRTADDLRHDCDLASLNWMFTYALADETLVATLLYSRIREKQLEAYCPADFIAALQVIHAANAERNAQHRQILLQTVAILNQAAITPCLLKGAHALMGLMPDAESRLIRDIDLLVAKEQAQTAKRALLQAGYYQDNQLAQAAEDDEAHHQLKPLYHPSGRGYVEIHRHPNFALLYPNLMDAVFNPDQLNLAERDGVRFYYNHPWQLLLYNQIHHFHSDLDATARPDLRQLAEQSALLHRLAGDTELASRFAAVLGKQATQAHLQFTLLAELFGDSPPAALMPPLPGQAAAHLQDIVGKMLGDPASLKRRRWVAFASLFSFAAKQLVNPTFLKHNLTKAEWYRNLIPKVLSAVVGGRKKV